VSGRTIELHITMAADARVSQGFKPVEQAAKQAQAFVAKEMGKVEKDIAKATAMMASENKKRNADVAKSLADITKQQAKREADMTATTAKESQARAKAAMKEWDERARAAKKARDDEAKDIQRIADQEEKAQKKITAAKEAARKKEGAEQTRSIRSMGSSTVSTVGAIAGRAMSVGGSIARGAGVDLDVGSQVGKAVSLGQSSIDITNSGFLAKGQNATASDVAATKNSIISAGDSSKTDYGTVAAGLDQFVSITGKLEEGKQVIANIGNLAKASGAKFSDLAQAAGEVSNALGDVPDKGKAIDAVLRQIAYSGAQGSVEIKDMAEYGARLTGTARLISDEQHRAEGIAQMSVLAQTVRAFTKTDAAEASGAAKSFVEDMGNYRNIKGKKTGMGSVFGGEEEASKVIFSDKGRTQMNSPESIIAAVYDKTKGDQVLIAQAFGNKQGRAVVEAFSEVYKKSGTAGIHAEFKRLGGSMTEEQVKNAADLSKNSDASNVTAFNNELTKIADSMAGKVLPALEKAGPQLLALADSTAKVVAWAVSNPGEAITLAIAASIGKAALGEVIGKTLAGSLAGNLGKNLTALSVGFATFEITKAMVTIIADQIDNGTARHVGDQADLYNQVGAGKMAQEDVEVAIRKGDKAKEAEAKARRDEAEQGATRNLNDRQANIEKYDNRGATGGMHVGGYSLWDAGINAVNGDWGQSIGDQKRAQTDKGELGIERIKADQELAKSAGEHSRAAGELAVAAQMLQNLHFNMPGVDPGGQTPGGVGL
jgi:hypothetical protein